ncbi:hypothetical protein M413DRAFT_444289 [Hebeloma cylindrosporum]|uniref:BTB domain-containing protein n=1 Tax=Hebeloma cylindrosporum TaxID=76867 RepID=A0A0C3CG50_HEBCY|nr:hypothetical protein M413DRAFT_444289 [Hebeloma cylindrosporum h7]
MESTAPSESSMKDFSSSNLTTSPLFSDSAADITFKSSDGMLFKIYRKYLEATSAGFTAPPFVETDQDPVLLQEPSEVLEILFRFVHPPMESQQYHQPNMADVEPEVLFAVAEAADKYLVYGAMNICLSRMDKFADKYPLKILNHSYKHGYDELADRTAPLTVGFRLPAVAAKLTCPGLLQKWIVYYDRWMELSHFTWLWMQDSPYTRCGKVIGWQLEFFKRFAENPRSIFPLPPVPPFTKDCPYENNCHVGDLNALSLEIIKMGKAIPKFTSILIPSR